MVSTANQRELEYLSDDHQAPKTANAEKVAIFCKNQIRNQNKNKKSKIDHEIIRDDEEFLMSSSIRLPCKLTVQLSVEKHRNNNYKNTTWTNTHQQSSDGKDQGTRMGAGTKEKEIETESERKNKLDYDANDTAPVPHSSKEEEEEVGDISGTATAAAAVTQHAHTVPGKWATGLSAPVLEYILLFVIDYNPVTEEEQMAKEKEKELILWKSMCVTCKDWNQKLHFFTSNEKYYFSRLYFKLYFHSSSLPRFQCYNNNNSNSSISVFTENPQQKRLTAVFIDWDDTIFPTAYLQYLQQTHDDKQLFQSNARLQQLIRLQIETLLQLIFSYGAENIFIVTNADPSWMVKCMTTYFNNDYQMLFNLIFYVYKIQCISARNMAHMFVSSKKEKRTIKTASVSGDGYCSSYDPFVNGCRAKTLVFAYILMKNLFKKAKIDEQCTTDVNIINIGDQEKIEMKAMKIAMQKIDQFYKNTTTTTTGVVKKQRHVLRKHLTSVNLLPKPSLETMIIEWQYIQSKIRDFGTCEAQFWNVKYQEEKRAVPTPTTAAASASAPLPTVIVRCESFE